MSTRHPLYTIPPASIFAGYLLDADTEAYLGEATARQARASLRSRLRKADRPGVIRTETAAGERVLAEVVGPGSLDLKQWAALVARKLRHERATFGRESRWREVIDGSDPIPFTAVIDSGRPVFDDFFLQAPGLAPLRVAAGKIATVFDLNGFQDRHTNAASIRFCKPLRLVTLPLAAHGQRAASEMPPDLAAVVAAWPTLPEAIRAGIVAMVRAALT